MKFKVFLNFKIIILILFTFVFLTSCKLAKVDDVIGSGQNDLLVGLNFSFINNVTNDEVLKNNDKYFKIYLVNDLKENSTNFYANKGFINVDMKTEIDDKDDLKVITNQIYAEIVFNSTVILHNDGLYLDKDGQLISGSGSAGFHLMYGSTAINNFDVENYQMDNAIINNHFEFKFYILIETLVKVKIEEYNFYDEVINQEIIKTDDDQDYYLNQETEYILISEKYLDRDENEIIKRHLINKSDIIEEYYFSLMFFNEYGFIEGNSLKFKI